MLMVTGNHTVKQERFICDYHKKHSNDKNFAGCTCVSVWKCDELNELEPIETMVEYPAYNQIHLG